jgi:hypothetical protein
MKINCKNCAYCYETDMRMDHPDKYIHECRRKAPVCGSKALAHAWWPNVYLSDGCGEFKEKT